VGKDKRYKVKILQIVGFQTKAQEFW